MKGVGGKVRAGWCRCLQEKECECTIHVHTCPLLKSAWLKEWGKEREKWLRWPGLGEGAESPAVAVCVHPWIASKCWYSRLHWVGCPWVPCEPSPGPLTCSLGLLSTSGCPRRLPKKLCLVAWPAGSMPAAGPRRRGFYICPLPGKPCLVSPPACPLGLGPGSQVGNGTTLELPGQGVIERRVLLRQSEASKVHITQLKRD